MSKINVSIVGSTGYTGLELIRILAAHPNVELKYLVSESTAGMKISEVWPHLQSVCDVELTSVSLKKVAEESDFIFFALPHGKAKELIPEILGLTKIIDLSADFRADNEKFVYGVPEFFAKKIAEAQNIANPGCFAITIETGLYPVKEFLKNAEIFAITGSSGLGKHPQDGGHHPVRNHNVKSYKIGTHQHLDEIAMTLETEKSALSFVPTSGPFTRGIHATVFVEFNESKNESEIAEIYEKFYANKPFIRLKKEIQVADVVGSNFCDISLNFVNGKLIVQVVIDNLVKGASGTAIQNMNIMAGLPEDTGLKFLTPLFP